MLTTTLAQLATERNLAERALRLFTTSYGLGWEDSYRAAEYEQTHGSARLHAVLRIVERDGVTFAQAKRIAPTATAQVEHALSDLLIDLDHAEDLANQLDAGQAFDAGVELRAARLALMRAITMVAQPTEALETEPRGKGRAVTVETPIAV